MSWFWKFLINEIEHESRLFPSVEGTSFRFVLIIVQNVHFHAKR